jgi:hypothetical protein
MGVKREYYRFSVMVAGKIAEASYYFLMAKVYAIECADGYHRPFYVELI